MRTVSKLAVLAVALVLAVLLVSCGDDNGDGNGEPVPTDAPTAAGEHEEGDEHEDEEGALHLTLTEWAIEGEGGGPVPAVAAGEVIFEVHNEGETVHEVAVIRTDQDPAGLPYNEDDLVVDEEAAGELVGRTDMIGAGDIEILTLDLEAGTYALICNIADHYDSGMYAQLVVE